ncbi:MAG: hypothetical protein ABI792_04895 [bacterium]
MISRKNRDVKFIIYQSLYIFVIAVLALKGANLDLTEVIKKPIELTENKGIVDSLKAMLDSLTARGIFPEITFDTSHKFTNIEELRKKLAETQQRLNQQVSVIPRTDNQNPSFSLDKTSPNISSNNNSNEKEKIAERKKEEETEESKDQREVEFRVPQSFTQYTSNSVSNPSDQNIEVYGSDGSLLTTVPPKSSRSFTLGGQTSLTFKRGGVSKTVSTKENAKPKITLQRLVPSGENVSVRSLQATVGYRVTVTDDYPGQLDIKFSGPVSVKPVSALVYDVTLDFFRSKTAFDNYSENREAPYSVTFQVSIKDKIATQHSINQSGVFQFGEW